jgi:Cys-tRNA(Pro)/Cys-tRNA(Cys) deacylase
MARSLGELRLAEAGVPHRLHTVGDGVDSGPAMAAALGVDPADVLRSLVCELEYPPRSGSGPGRRQRALVLAGSDRPLDEKRLARGTGARRARLASGEEAERWSGLRRGGISPLAVAPGRFEVWLDARAADRPRIFVSAGARGFELELAPADQARVCDGRWLDLG